MNNQSAMCVHIKAYAKLNISLDVVSKMEKGYHALRMVMESVSLCDDIYLEARPEEQVSVSTNLHFLPNDTRNIAVKAANLFFQKTDIRGRGVFIRITKRIPVCAGLAGGSSNAAAVLRGLNSMFRTGFTRRELEEMGEKLGSDVPYCVAGGTVLAEGRGEKITALRPMPKFEIVICKPHFSVSTADLFSLVDGQKIRHRPDTQGLISAIESADQGSIARRMYNVFEDILAKKNHEVLRIKNSLLDYGALGATMSGTGPSVFGLFDDREKARRAYEELGGSYKECFLTRNIDRLEI